MPVIGLLIVGICLVAAALIPGIGFNMDGIELTWRDLWRTGIAIALLVVGPLMATVGIGVLYAKAWARPALVALPALQVLPFYVVHWAMGSPSLLQSISPGLFLGLCAAWGLGAVIGLYVLPVPRNYFEARRMG